MNKKLMGQIVVCIVIISVGLVCGMSFIPKRGDPGNPEYTKSIVKMDPITIVEWNHRFEGENVSRMYDEQTHMVCYERNGESQGCSTLDLGILPDEMKSGIDTPQDQAIIDSHHMWREGEPDEPETVHGR